MAGRNHNWKRRAGVSNGTWSRIRRRVFDRDGWACVKCGRPGRLECDHIVALSAGGSNDMDNLRTLCRDCHIQISRAERQAKRAAERPRYAPGFAAMVSELQDA